jgi:hypothetical protein
MNLSFEEARRRDGAAVDGHSAGKGKDLIHGQILSIQFRFEHWKGTFSFCFEVGGGESVNHRDGFLWRGDRS